MGISNYCTILEWDRFCDPEMSCAMNQPQNTSWRPWEDAAETGGRASSWQWNRPGRHGLNQVQPEQWEQRVPLWHADGNKVT